LSRSLRAVKHSVMVRRVAQVSACASASVMSSGTRCPVVK